MCGIDINAKGEIIATGYTKAGEDGFLFIAEEAEGFLMKTDAEGNLIWDQVLKAPQGTKVRIKKDGSYVVFTDTDSESPSGENNYGFMKIEPDTESISNY